MRKLTVVHKYKDSLKINLGKLPEDITVVSLEEGAGRARIPAGEKFDFVVFQKCSSASDMVNYTDKMESFYRDLTRYNLIDENTILQ